MVMFCCFWGIFILTFNKDAMGLTKHLILTNWSRVTHICVNKTYHHWFRWWLVAWSGPSHYLIQCWKIVDWTLGNKFKWNLNQNLYIFTNENAFENVVLEMSAILFRLHSVNIHFSVPWTCFNAQQNQTTQLYVTDPLHDETTIQITSPHR